MALQDFSVHIGNSVTLRPFYHSDLHPICISAFLHKDLLDIVMT